MKTELNNSPALSPDREERAKEVLKQLGWNEKFPIPVKWDGNAKSEDLRLVNIVHTSGDDKCFWLRDAVSAVILFFLGHDLENSKEILKKQDAFNG